MHYQNKIEVLNGIAERHIAERKSQPCPECKGTGTIYTMLPNGSYMSLPCDLCQEE